MEAKHTPWPWRWELNEKYKSLNLVGGRPKYDLTIINPTRWGMGSATLLIRDTAHDGMNILHKLHERRDWIAPHEGRAHHADWCADVVHPDMRLIAAAPELLEALQRVMDLDCPMTGNPSHAQLVEFWEYEKTQGRGEADDRLFALAAIAKATT